MTQTIKTLLQNNTISLEIEYEGTWEDLNLISYGKYAFGENKLTIKCSDMTVPDMYW